VSAWGSSVGEARQQEAACGLVEGVQLSHAGGGARLGWLVWARVSVGDDHPLKMAKQNINHL
jgi:hypothetical protein